MAGFNHRIKQMSPESVAKAVLNDYWIAQCHATFKCKNRSSHMAMYDYITGRGGRRSYKEVAMCDEHAQKFIKKYDAQIVA